MAMIMTTIITTTTTITMASPHHAMQCNALPCAGCFPAPLPCACSRVDPPAFTGSFAETFLFRLLVLLACPVWLPALTTHRHLLSAALCGLAAVCMFCDQVI